MDARREPRFSIYGPVKATLLGSPETQFDCVLLDISATGLKLVSSASMPIDDILAIEADDHLALADVRYCQPRGDKFTIGCERIHVMQKVSLPDDKSKAEQIRQLVDDYRTRMRDGIVSPHPDANPGEAARFEQQLLNGVGNSEKAAPAPEKPEAPPPEKPADAVPSQPKAAFATREQLLDAAAGWAIEHWEKVPSQPQEAAAGRSEIVDRLAVRLADKLRAIVPPPQAPIEAPPAASKTPEASEAAQPPKAVKKKPPTVEKKKSPAWRVPLGVAAAGVLGWGLSALFWSLGTTGAASYLPPSIASLISEKKTPPPDPVPSVPRVQIKAIETTWVVATSDGKRVFSKKLVKNDTREIQFSDKVVLQVGNAKGLEIRLDGKPIGSIGVHGEPRVVELSADGFRFLPVR